MNSPFLLIVGLLACVVRFCIASGSEENLLAIMAMINIVAFDYVVLILTQGARSLVIDRTEKSQLPEETKRRNITTLNVCYGFFYFFVFAVLGIAYVSYLHSSALNDSVSIMALVISICSDRISNPLANFIYEILDN